MQQTSSADGPALVEVSDLAKRYGAIRAVDGIGLRVARGDVLGFLGPNGAGKTTAMKMITGFLTPDRGRIRVAGFELPGGSLEARRRIGYLPENAPAYEEMTVRGFLGFVARAREVAAADAAIGRAVERTGLGGVFDQTVGTLSKGFRRRVGLAQALLHDPEVLILDEPTDGLDPNQKVLVHRLIDELAPERAIVLSTHVLAEVERVCNRAIIISRGRILVDSTPGELISRAPGHNHLRVELAEPPSAALVAAIESQEWCEAVERPAERELAVKPRRAENRLNELLELLEGAGVRQVRQREGRLDDLFRVVTEGVST